MKRSRGFFTLLLLLLPFFLYAQEGKKILKIEVIGNERIDKGVILKSLKTKEGEGLELEKIREDIKNIFRIGYFSDVQVDVKEEEEGVIVTFFVVERPLIKEIYIKGNKKVKTSDISEKIKVKTQSVLNIEKIRESLSEIEKLYVSKGYYGTKINYQIDYEDLGAKVGFIIEEAEKVFVKKISFIGNKKFKEKTLKSVMKIKEKDLFSWFTGSGILDEEELENDRKRIETFYADNGYVRAKVAKPEVQFSKKEKGLIINMRVDEGEVYNVGDIDFSGDRIEEKGVLLKGLKTKKGEVFRSSFVQDDVFKLQEICQDQGYAFCEVTPLTEIEDDLKKVHVTFDISKGEEVYIGRINISGNTRTREKVIRRELTLLEGDRFSLRKFRKSKTNLNNTLFFNNVDLKLLPAEDEGLVNIDVIVEERPTGSISLGAGYSSAEKLLFTASISQENLFGTGRKLYLQSYLSSVSKEFDFTFVEPYFLDRDLSTTLNLLNYTKYFDTYDYKKAGGSTSFARPLKEDMKIGLRYRYERTKVFNIKETASRYVKEQRGKKSTSSATLFLIEDTIDDKLNPSKGVYAEASLEVAGGPFRGDNYFVKPIVSYGRYFPLRFLKSSFFIKGEAGIVEPFGGKSVPIYEKFFLGGIHTIRGFKYGMAGKKDEEGEPIGNEKEIFFNFEWIFPIKREIGLKGVVFYDVGSGFDKIKEFELRHGAGLGIRWFSPIGPMRIELGFNLFPKKGEKRSVFDFTIGTQY